MTRLVVVKALPIVPLDQVLTEPTGVVIGALLDRVAPLRFNPWLKVLALLIVMVPELNAIFSDAVILFTVVEPETVIVGVPVKSGTTASSAN